MARFKKRVVASFLVGTMILAGMSTLTEIQNTKIVSAESRSLLNARNKVEYLIMSIKKNYLGIKNQSTWQNYINQSKSLIRNIPSAEKAQKDELTTKLDRIEALVDSIGRINYVEKSTTSKENGGYGNYLGIKNTKTWNEYLEIAKKDLKRVDRNIFGNEYTELLERIEPLEELIAKIENEYSIEYNNINELFESARQENDVDKVKEVLELAKNLGSSDKTKELVISIEDYIYRTTNGNNVDIVNIALNEEGYKEGYGNDTKYGEWFGENYEPWCAIFIVWSADMAGVPESVIPRTSDVVDLLNFAREKGLFKEKGTYIPEAGDIFINKELGASHIGIVISSDDTHFYAMEGNYGNKVTKVKRRLDSLQLTGFFTPDYAKRGVPMINSLGSIEAKDGNTD